MDASNLPWAMVAELNQDMASDTLDTYKSLPTARIEFGNKVP
jgi:hypothetical protein